MQDLSSNLEPHFNHSPNRGPAFMIGMYGARIVSKITLMVISVQNYAIYRVKFRTLG